MQPSAFLARLRRALIADFGPELELALKVAVLQAAGYRRSEIASKLATEPAFVRAAEARVKSAAERLDQHDREETSA